MAPHLVKPITNPPKDPYLLKYARQQQQLDYLQADDLRLAHQPNYQRQREIKTRKINYANGQTQAINTRLTDHNQEAKQPMVDLPNGDMQQVYTQAS